MRISFVLMICAFICVIASVRHGVGFDGLALVAVLFIILAGLVWLGGRKARQMQTLFYVCPDCGGSIESEGRDESSRQAVRDFIDAHQAEHAAVTA